MLNTAKLGGYYMYVLFNNANKVLPCSYMAFLPVGVKVYKKKLE